MTSSLSELRRQQELIQKMKDAACSQGNLLELANLQADDQQIHDEIATRFGIGIASHDLPF